MDRQLPQIAADYIDLVIKAMKYRKSIRQEVRRELTDHFLDALDDCCNEPERLACIKELIAEFGDAKLLGTLMRRGKKRCRPLWQKIAVTGLQVVGITFVLLLLRIGYMATGRPTISVDYTLWMNDKVRNGRDESLNAWHDYQKAVELLTDQPPEIEKIEGYTRQQKKTHEDWIAIESFLKINAEMVRAFREGASKPYYWNIYQKNDLTGENELAGEVVDGLMTSMTGYKKLARHFCMFQIPFELHQGNQQQAIDDCITLCTFGKHLSHKGVFIENLVGVAIDAMAWSVANDVLTETDISAGDLLRLQTIIENDYDPDTAYISWKMEKAFWYDQIQQTFTDDGKGSGRPLVRGTLLAANDWTDYIDGLLTGFPDRREAIESIDTLFAKADESRSITPWELESGTYNLDELKRVMENAGVMRPGISPTVEKTLQIGWRCRTGQAGLIGTLSILRFEKENGRLPNGWEELLVRGYLKTVPMDPYSGKPLVYRITDDGFTLYSVGLNFKDDNGRCGEKNGHSTLWADNGDAVFWPVIVNQ